MTIQSQDSYSKEDGKMEKNSKQGSKTLAHAIDITYFPDPIMHDIFCRLPVRTILSCKCVCKEWNRLIKEPIFPRIHFSHASVSPVLRTFEPRFWPTDLHLVEVASTDDLVPPLKLHSKLSPPQLPLIHVDHDLEIPKFGIVNSCNGLLCVCTNPFNNPIYVCNPITGEYMMLPKPERNSGSFYYTMDKERAGKMFKSHFVVSGFGFSPNTNQYKVIRMLDLVADEDVGYVIIQVFTLGSSSWRNVGGLGLWQDIGLGLSHAQFARRPEAPYKRSFCVYLNGAVHWLCDSQNSPFFIVSFDFEHENMVEILPPAELLAQGKRGIGNMRLGVLHDRLYLTGIDSYFHFKLWVLDDYNDQSSWILEGIINTFSLNIWPRGLYQPIKYLDKGELLMFHPSNALVCYNTKEGSFRYFKIHGIDSDFEMAPHIPSLISMKDVINVEDQQAQILNTRDNDKPPIDWKEYHGLELAEEDEEAIDAAYSKIVLENTSFGDAFTDRHW